MKPPTMYDVAQRAGVSHQTVSRALNQPELVAPQTLARVEKALTELGYRMDEAAQLMGRRGGRATRAQRTPTPACPTCGSRRVRRRPGDL